MRTVYQTPAPDFELSRLQMAKGESINLTSGSVEIFLIFTGSAEVSEAGKNQFKRSKGEAWVSFDKAVSEIKALEDTIIYQASIPGIG